MREHTSILPAKGSIYGKSDFLYLNKFHLELKDQMVHTLFINEMFKWLQAFLWLWDHISDSSEIKGN